MFMLNQSANCKEVFNSIPPNINKIEHKVKQTN